MILDRVGHDFASVDPGNPIDLSLGGYNPASSMQTEQSQQQLQQFCYTNCSIFGANSGGSLDLSSNFMSDLSGRRLSSLSLSSPANEMRPYVHDCYDSLLKYITRSMREMVSLKSFNMFENKLMTDLQAIKAEVKQDLASLDSQMEEPLATLTPEWM